MIVGEKRIDRCDLRGNQSDHQSVSRLLAGLRATGKPDTLDRLRLGRRSWLSGGRPEWRSRSEHPYPRLSPLGPQCRPLLESLPRERAETKNSANSPA